VQLTMALNFPRAKTFQTSPHMFNLRGQGTQVILEKAFFLGRVLVLFYAKTQTISKASKVFNTKSWPIIRKNALKSLIVFKILRF
jgi:hypothetical protein